MRIILFLLIFIPLYSFEQNLEYGILNENESFSNIRWNNINFLKLELENKPENHIIFFRLKLPATNLNNKAIYYYSTEQFYEIYVDDLKPENKLTEFHYGKFITDKLSFTTGENFKIIKLNDNFSNRYLYFKIFYANPYTFLKHRKLSILPLEEIYRNLIKENIFGFIFSFIIMISGILLIVISLTKYFEKIAFLGAGLFFLFLGLKQVSENLLILFIYNFPFIWGYLAFFSSFLMMPGLFLFLDVILRKKFFFIINIFFYIQLLIIAIVSIFEMFGFFALSKILEFYFIYLMGIIIILFSFLVFASLENNKEAKYLTMGGLFLFFSSLYEILARGFGIFKWNKIILDLGVIVFIYSIIYILFYRFIYLYKEKEDYVKELNKKNNQFLLIKEQLEQILSQKNIELETAINRIKINKSAVERELELAKRIQNFLIPANPPSYEISAFYKPMEQVCGDFYDFIEISRNRIGIFISDVSGHGVPAALITSMIKSAIIQMKNDLDNPSKFLKRLNDFLFIQLEGHFVTAFYGIYDRDTRRFTYANAGHIMPYKINKEKIEILSHENRGLPLGIVKTEELTNLDKLYINKTIKLKKEDKLFLYTDGLIEAIPFENSQSEDVNDFGSSNLKLILESIKNFSASDIIEILYQKLIEFRGCDSFDDDICMICIEIK